MLVTSFNNEQSPMSAIVKSAKMGFPKKKLEDATSLAILVPGEGIDPKRPRERPVSLGNIVGKLRQGIGHLDSYAEDLRNIAKPVKPLNYGAFGSYAPSYDSTFATISKEDSSLIYGSYTDSVINVSKDYDYTLTMADNLLDMLSHGEYKKSAKESSEKEADAKQKQEQVNNTAVTNANPEIQIDQLKTLTELGIDISFLSDYEKMVEEASIQKKLDESCVLLEKLQEVQIKRLSGPLPPHLSRLPQPSEVELQLVDKVTGSLRELAKQVPPSSLISVTALRQAMRLPAPTN